MYWPIGAPRVYAASNSRASKNRITESDDNAESRETTEGSGPLVEVPTNSSDDQGDEENDVHSGMSTPLTPVTPGIKPVEHDTQRRFPLPSNGPDTSISGSAEKEPLLSLKVSRTGHLFAVITSTSLTIWQTKVMASTNFEA